MTSFGYRLNPFYAIKECLSCGALYTGEFCCSKWNVEDKILVTKLPKNYARCAKCGHPVNGPYCQGCTLLREKLEEDLVTYFQNFQNTSESSDGSTNVVNAPREPFVVKQDHGVNSPHIDECCCECGEALDGIICQQRACKSCGKGAHIGYNCPPKVPIISNPKPCNRTMNNEPPRILPSFDPIDDDSLYYENIEYVEASPHDSELVSLESSSTSLKSFLEETNTFHNSLLEFENFCFDLEEISSGGTTTHSDISVLEYEAFSFYDDHIEEISSGSTATPSDISLPEYDSFIFDISNDQFPPSDK
nr:hypothetical protein [Tanacetum cinerariifolium]